MKILVLDNYDSFTYNLVQILKQQTNYQVDVARNDEITLDEISPYQKILLSPGPGIPDEAGIMKEVINKYASSKSILGVCLGMQAIAEVFNGKLYNMNKVYHGIESDIKVIDTEETLFKNLPKELTVGRYHSWAVDAGSLPHELEVTATDQEGIIMALRHKKFDVKGVQFHPESVMTPYGKNMLANWLQNGIKRISLPQNDSANYNINNLKRGYLFC